MQDCIFCKIIARDTPSEFIKESDNFIVVKDIQPQAPIHFLIISKKHIESISHLGEADQHLIGQMLYQAKLLAAEHGLAERGYKVVINCGQDGGQVVPHLHFHFLGGKKMAGLV